INEQEMEELRLAAWMHDVGKIATPEYIVNKTSKLEGIFDRMPLIKTRFNLIEKNLENEYLKKKIDLIGQPIGEQSTKQQPTKQQAQLSVQESVLRMENELSCVLKIIKDDLEFINKSNQSREYMVEADVERIKAIAEKTFDIDGISHPFLKSDEVECLCIRKGNLSSRERDTIKEHANMTFKILEQLPFHQKLARVPEYAAGHHEHPDGSGYPRGLAGDNLPLQSRIMAIADIFEALTAKDRPYKKKMSLSRAMNILDKMKNDGHIDPDIYDLFKQAGIYHTYAQKRLDSEQLDL
ncbi:HD domain-containing phosphohydrolase, partial [Desulfobacterales bacterium HSG16]|nr:HD domain-containing phosphohydrolase [Desulfobacterales bacterium HSG16]